MRISGRQVNPTDGLMWEHWAENSNIHRIQVFLPAVHCPKMAFSNLHLLHSENSDEVRLILVWL